MSVLTGAYPSSSFNRVDLPTLLRPAMAISGMRAFSGGKSLSWAAVAMSLHDFENNMSTVDFSESDIAKA